MGACKPSWTLPRTWLRPSRTNWPRYELRWLCVHAWLGLALLILSGCASGTPTGDVSCAELAVLDPFHTGNLELADLYRRHCTTLPAPALLENLAGLR